MVSGSDLFEYNEENKLLTFNEETKQSISDGTFLESLDKILTLEINISDKHTLPLEVIFSPSEDVRAIFKERLKEREKAQNDEADD